MKIAVVGSGIAGLGAAWALSQSHDVHVFEANDRLGGHANTVTVDVDGEPVDVDTGFIVYNERTYPNLTRLFDALGVETADSDMSFSFSMKGGREYAGSLSGLVAAPSQLFSRRHLAMVRDILRFRKLGEHDGAGMTVGEFLWAHRLSSGFVEDYLVPMTAAIWSARSQDILDFPASTMLSFLRNHGLVKVTDRPQWRTVRGGSRHYVERLARDLTGPVVAGSPITGLRRHSLGVDIETARGFESFDHVVLAVHSDQAMRILGSQATPAEGSILSRIRYQDNHAVLHTDRTQMPRRHRLWSSWNHMTTPDRHVGRRVSVTYWMNRLQPLATERDLFVSLNPQSRPGGVLAEFSYAHPVFDRAAVTAQRQLARIQGKSGVWFAGAWTGYGFHEDGLASGLKVAAALGTPAPWAGTVDDMSTTEWTPVSAASSLARSA